MPIEAFPGCADPVARNLPEHRRREIVAWHQGKPSPSSGMCAGEPRADSSLAVGYVTIDTVGRCSNLDPTDDAYFGTGGSRVAVERNVLLGDIFQVDLGNDFASGNPAVHLVADRDLYNRPGKTFYDRYVNGTGRDYRQPLPRAYANRYLSGGAFDGGTEITVWRDTRDAAARPVACDRDPEWHPLPSRAAFTWDEDCRAHVLGADAARFPVATQRVRVGGEDLPTDADFGWLLVDLGIDGGGQGWLDVKLDAMGRFSVGMPSAGLATACAN